MKKEDIYIDKDRICVRGLFEPKTQLYSKEAQSPVFVSTYRIMNYDGPDVEEDTYGRMTFKGYCGETLKGYRCNDIEAFYMWTPNGPNKGFLQTLICRFKGSESHFNYLIRLMQNRNAEFIILLPRKDKPYIVIDNQHGGINLDIRSVEHQTFALTSTAIMPFPYYDGPIEIEDCTERELTKELY